MKNILISLLLAAASLAAAPIVYEITVDTSAFAGQDAMADFQFNPGGLPDSATLLLSGISGVGSFAEHSRTGDVTGTDPWTFDNVQPLNQLLLDLTGLTATLHFLIAFSGDAVDNPFSLDGTGFFFTLLDPTGAAPLAGFSAPSLWLDLSQGAVTVFAQDPQIGAAPVPEPATFAVVGFALVGLAVSRRRRDRQ